MFINNLTNVINKGNVVIKQLQIVIFFTLLYWLYGKVYRYIKKYDYEYKEFKRMDLFESFYFSLVTQTTVGYGDITVMTRNMRILNCIQLLSVYGVLFLSFKNIF